jgi:hypothetical protein
MLNNNTITSYMKEARMVLLSKSKSPETTIEETRPIMVMSHLTKIYEKCIKNKLTQC